MKLASINCNKRLSNPKYSEMLRQWLVLHDIDFLLIQEPWPHSIVIPADIHSYKSLGGNTNVYAWVKEDLNIAQGNVLESYMQRLTVGDLTIFNMYFTYTSQKRRAEQLKTMEKQLATLNGQPAMVVGDFNLAPNPEDGLSGDRISKWSGLVDSGLLQEIMKKYHLVDTTSKSVVGQQLYSLDRIVRNVRVRFRCDLCLVTNFYISGQAFSIKYDHTVREKIYGFTDHSALIIHLPED